MRIYPLHFSLICLSCCLLNACGGSSSGFGTSGNIGVFVTPPTINGATNINAPGPIVFVQPDVQDPDSGDILQYTWSVVSGPTSVIAAGSPGNNGATHIQFPVKGNYTIQLRVQDRGGNISTEDFQIHLNSTATTNISGTLTLSNTNPQSNISTALRWVPAGNVNILSSKSDVNGDFSFNNLLGDPEDFQVFVP